MADLLFLIPLSPLVGFLILFCTLGNLPRKAVAVVGIGSIAISALITVFVGKSLLGNNIPLSAEIYTWINVGGFAPAVSFYVDGLTLTMMSVITGVGLLIHMDGFSRACSSVSPEAPRFSIMITKTNRTIMAPA